MPWAAAAQLCSQEPHRKSQGPRVPSEHPTRHLQPHPPLQLAQATASCSQTLCPLPLAPPVDASLSGAPLGAQPPSKAPVVFRGLWNRIRPHLLHR